MKEKGRIKSYYIKKDKIIIKYDNKKIEKYNLNRSNLKKLINKLNKQYDFTMESVNELRNSTFNRVTYLTFIACVIEAIISLSIFLSFKGGEMFSFNVFSILSLVWIAIYFLYLFLAFIKFKIIKRKYKICLGREFLQTRYDNLKPAKTKTKRVLAMC